jgi:hypothetical protein
MSKKFPAFRETQKHTTCSQAIVIAHFQSLFGPVQKSTFS